MAQERFERIFRDLLKEAPVDVSLEQPAEVSPSLGVKTDHEGLQSDLQQTASISNPIPAERLKTLKKMENWVIQAGSLATEINNTDKNSWVNTITKLFPPEQQEQIIKSLSKAAVALDGIKNEMSTIIAIEKGKITGTPSTPPESSSL